MARGLGRGFESLIPTELVDDEFDPTVDETKEVSKLVDLKLDEIVRDEEQPRTNFDQKALEDLASSIKTHGVLQPIVVTKKDGGYQIVAGERRWRAAKLAGLSTIPAIVRTLDAQERLGLSIIENAQREDLNAIELATAYAKLKSQFNLTDKQIADQVGKSEGSIKGTLRLLNLPDFAKKAMLEHNLSEGVMRPLATADEKIVEKVLPKIVEDEWTARQVEKFMSENRVKSSTAVVIERMFEKQEKRLAEKYTAKVKVKNNKITFTCKDEKELKELLDKLI